MSWYPAARRIPLDFYGYPSGDKGGNQVMAVVHHIASGWWGTLIDPGFWQSRNGGSGGSVHFAVSLTGEVVQFVDTADAAYGNGIVLNPSWPPASIGNPNEYTVSIEHEGLTGVPWPEAMYQASLKLTRWIMQTHDLALTPDTLIGHYRIDSVNRAQCPGAAWPAERYFAELEEPDMTPEEARAIARAEAIAILGYDPATRNLTYNQAHGLDGHSNEKGRLGALENWQATVDSILSALTPWTQWAGQPLLMQRVKRFIARLVSKNPTDHPGQWPAD